ncbi:DUF6340 family protein [Bacteroidia bacterium]|jgi:hypothetical protein|nr:DUF6340 family protein [Bacteroidia bacterium]
MKKQLIILLTLLSACASTQQVSYVTGVSQATVTLPEGARKVTVVNRVRLAYPYNKSTTLLNPNNPNLLNAAFSTLQSSIQNQGYLRILSQSNAFKQNANSIFPTPLSTLDLKQMATGSDLVISLEKFGQRIEDTYTIDIRRENLGNSTYREVDFYIGKRTINVSLGWKLYNTETGEVIDTWEEKDNYFYESEARTRVRATELLRANYRRELQNKGNKYGRRYAARISPTVNRRTVPLYSNGNEALQKGILAVRGKNWKEAKKIWTNGLLYEEKRRKKAMLLHNLAINQVRKGDVDKARRFAAQAAEQHPLGVKTQGLVGFAPADL